MTERDHSEIRPAEERDLPFLARVMRTAATSHLDRCVWDTLFGLGADQVDALFTAAAVSEQQHWCHLSRFWIAEVAGNPVGALSGFDTATEGTDVLAQVLLAHAERLESDQASLAGLLDRAAVLRDATPADWPGTWGIENVAVLEHHRGTGVVDALLAHALRAGRDRGYRNAQILCLNGNQRAQRTWQRHGFQVRADYRHQRFQDVYGCPGMKLLVREL